MNQEPQLWGHGSHKFSVGLRWLLAPSGWTAEVEERHGKEEDSAELEMVSQSALKVFAVAEGYSGPTLLYAGDDEIYSQ